MRHGGRSLRTVYESLYARCEDKTKENMDSAAWLENTPWLGRSFGAERLGTVLTPYRTFRTPADPLQMGLATVQARQTFFSPSASDACIAWFGSTQASQRSSTERFVRSTIGMPGAQGGR